MIQRTYLQWVGTSHFATVEDFCADVRERGVCKKLPNKNVATEVAKPGTAIFLAHDQGRLRECLTCAELVTCPTCLGNEFVEGKKCMRCKGLGALERGTGGHALVDGETWTYVRLMQLKKNRWHDFWKTQHEIENVQHCPTCGGRGRIPQGVVFALYVPSSVVYVARRSDSAKLRESLKFASIEIISKGARARRLQPGSFYALTLTDGASLTDETRLSILKLVGPCRESEGGLIKLHEPIPYEGKHFRGIKRWDAPGYIEEPTERDILEGVV